MKGECPSLLVVTLEIATVFEKSESDPQDGNSIRAAANVTYVVAALCLCSKLSFLGEPLKDE